mmetsp:Transcript_44095/g.93885  ORF Transcript_44095/g.93885 Transcript_44095/m.93885 type:complete len:241 (-) Transcript_44095:49-771(-)
MRCRPERCRRHTPCRGRSCSGRPLLLGWQFLSPWRSPPTCRRPWSRRPATHRRRAISTSRRRCQRRAAMFLPHRSTRQLQRQRCRQAPRCRQAQLLMRHQRPPMRHPTRCLPLPMRWHQAKRPPTRHLPPPPTQRRPPPWGALALGPSTEKSTARPSRRRFWAPWRHFRWGSHAGECGSQANASACGRRTVAVLTGGGSLGGASVAVGPAAFDWRGRGLGSERGSWSFARPGYGARAPRR